MSKVAVLFDMHPHAVSCSSASRGAGTCWRDVGRGDWVAGWQHAICDDKRAHVGCQTPYAVVGADRTVEGDVLDILAETTRRGLFPEGETPMLGVTDGARCPLFDACCRVAAIVCPQPLTPAYEGTFEMVSINPAFPTTNIWKMLGHWEETI